MSEPKDNWDKAEIVGKVALPIVIAAATLLYNNEVSARQQSSKMVELAIGIVTEPPMDDGEPEPLRLWAIDILQVNGGLTEEAASQLKFSSLPATAMGPGGVRLCNATITGEDANLLDHPIWINCSSLTLPSVGGAPE